jgi:GT2 family glycosyltransferase
MRILEEPFASIIIVNYNGINHLKECLSSINNLTYKNFEVILVDNNSHDNSLKFVRENFKNVKIIELNSNYGFSIGNNMGVLEAKGKFFALLNFDTYVDKSWLTELIKVAQSSDEIGIVASKIYKYSNKNIVDFAGSRCDKYGKSHHIGFNKKDHKLFNISREIFYACGAALLIKREIFEKIGLFDPFYFAYYEDLDLGWRTWTTGYRVIIAPKSIIYHKSGEVMKKQDARRKYFGERNLLRTLLKNYQISSLFKVLPIYYGKRIGIMLKYLLKFDKQKYFYPYVCIKAFFWNIFNFHSLLKYRKIVQINRKKDDKFIFQLMKKTVKLEYTLKKLI